MVKKTVEWIVQTHTDSVSGWEDISSSAAPAAGRAALAVRRSSEPQYLHRLIRREPGCTDTVLPD